jgi:diguanylate cyclase (GGDEF)-like protein
MGVSEDGLTEVEDEPAENAGAEVHVLLVTEDEHAAQRLHAVLAAAGSARFGLTRVARVAEALTLLQEGGYQALLLDLSLEESAGLESLYRARVAASEVPIIVLTYRGDEDLALKAARAGVQDYLIKGEVTPALITRSLLHAIERHRMVQELREAQQRQHHLATHDTLTGLRNRSALHDSLRSSLADARRNESELAVVFLDLDGFKPVNDNLGHAVGDELLADVAGRLRRIVRKSDHCARIGGDEFVVVIRNLADPGKATEVAEQIRADIERPYHVDDHELWISASIGVALYPRDGETAETLIRHADTAMYQAKGSGRNSVSSFEPEMNTGSEERFDLVNSLREAIHGGALVVAFQPQIDVHLEEVITAETLVRWNHPLRGLIAPGEFIGVAEEAGMIVPLGEWVLRAACTAAAGWTGLPHTRVAVNVSGRQLQHEDFPDRVGAILAEAELPPGRLELELTESLAANEQTLRAIARLRELGVRIAIDDFGTGYSSFTLLKRMPADLLKIDQSFVRDALGGKSGEVILDTIIRMGRGLGIDVLAEGVETIEEMDMLLSLGCHQMQGYLISKPISKADFEASVVAEDAAWRMPIQRPETWSPLPREELRKLGESLDSREDFSDAELPVLKD